MSAQNASTLTDEPLSSRARAALDASQAHRVVVAGVATAHVGLHRTALAYCVAMAALVALAAGSLMFRRRGLATGQGAN